MNNLNITGRIVYEPELKTTQNGATFISNRIAVNRNDKNKTTDFFNFQAWNKTADFICKYFKKGDPIEITGRLQTDSYEKKDGTKVNEVIILAYEVGFTLSKTGTASAHESAPAPAEDLEKTFEKADKLINGASGLPFEI